jgi:hypothetical protein
MAALTLGTQAKGPKPYGTTRILASREGFMGSDVRRNTRMSLQLEFLTTQTDDLPESSKIDSENVSEILLLGLEGS